MANNDNKSLLKHIRINIQRYIHLDLAAATAFYKSSYNPRTEAISNHPAVQKKPSSTSTVARSFLKNSTLQTFSNE